MSDEAHRTQNNLGTHLVINEGNKNAEAMAADEKIGAKVTFGFAKYLRDALPNATYVGFTGTPIDETVHVFGEVVDQYTMRESEADGITVPIKYDPRLARVFLNREEAEKVEAYYRLCADEGATKEDIEKSKAASRACKSSSVMMMFWNVWPKISLLTTSIAQKVSLGCKRQ
jgi:Type I site-specific restriction-modification system, R (restriction) subunit and related helicases